MSRSHVVSSRKAGKAPGELIFVGDRKQEKSVFSLCVYDEKSVDEHDDISFDGTLGLFGEGDKKVRWLNIDGLSDVKIIEKIGHNLSIHPLVLEDIVNTDQRPKVEFFDEYVFVVVKMLSWDSKEKMIGSEQVSFLLFENSLVSFQERSGDVFEPVRNRLRLGKGRLRKRSVDFLLYALLDAIADQYFVVLEGLGEQIEQIESEVLKNPDPEVVKRIYSMKNELIFLRKAAWPLRDCINSLLRDESEFVSEPSLMFFRDVYDHLIQVIDTVESYRDMVSGLLDIYLSSMSNKMNEVMKVLTIFASIFIPLTFVAGIYGMNFEVMPELSWSFGYPLVWIVFVAMSLIMLVFFKRKKWI